MLFLSPIGLNPEKYEKSIAFLDDIPNHTFGNISNKD